MRVCVYACVRDVCDSANVSLSRARVELSSLLQIARCVAICKNGRENFVRLF